MILIILLIIGLWYILNVGATWVVQWGLTEITGQDMPFWPIFWIIVVLTVMFGGSSQVGSK